MSVRKTKSRKGFPRRIATEEIGMEMTPMIDIVFLLLIFFMVTATFQRVETDPKVKLPTADAADPDQRVPGTTVVNVRQDGTITVNKRVYREADLPALFMQIVSDTPNPIVVVRGDRDSHLATFLRILQACAMAGIENVRVAVKMKSVRGRVGG